MRTVRTLLMTSSLSGIIVASASFAALPEQAGVAAAVNPTAEGTPPGQPSHYLNLGTNVARNEHIKTSPDGLTQILFNDGSTLSIGPSADVTIDEFVYDPSQKTGKLALSIASGALRLVGGQIANQNEVSVKTPAATIGIRGCIGGVTVEPGGATVAYLAYGTLLTVTGNTGPSQTTAKANVAITVQPGSASSPPVPLTPKLLQTVTASLEPQSNSTGGVAVKPTEQSVSSSGGSAVTASTVAAPSLAASVAATNTSTTQSTTNHAIAAATMAAIQTASQASVVTASQTSFLPNATFGPYSYSAYYDYTGSVIFKTGPDGVVNEEKDYGVGGPGVFTFTTNGKSTDVNGDALAQIGIWNGFILSGATKTESFLGQSFPYFEGIPTAQLPSSGIISYKLSSSTEIVNQPQYPGYIASGYIGSVITRSRFSGTLTAIFGQAGANTAALDLAGSVYIPNDATYNFSLALANKALTSPSVVDRGYYGNYNVGGNVTAPAGSIYCGTGSNCSVVVTGEFLGLEASRFAFGYAIIYNSAALGTYGTLQGAGLFQESSYSTSPSGLSTNSVGFYPNTIVAGVSINALESGGQYSIVGTDSTFSVNSNGKSTGVSFQQISGGGVGTLNGDLYAQVNRPNGEFIELGDYYNLPANSGNHSLKIIPTVGLPASGSLSYSLLTQTGATYSDGYTAPGHFTGTLNASFSSSGASLALSSLKVTMPDAVYNIANTSATTANAFFTATSSLTSGLSGSHLCPSTCSSIPVNFAGGFAGPGAQRAGFVYTFNNGGSGVGVAGGIIFRTPGATN